MNLVRAHSLFLYLTAFSIVLNAREPVNRDDTDYVTVRLRGKYPEIKEHEEDVKTKWQQTQRTPKAVEYANIDVPIIFHILYNSDYPDDAVSEYSKYVDIVQRITLIFNMLNPDITIYPLWQDRLGNMSMTFSINRIIWKDVGGNSPYNTSDAFDSWEVIMSSVNGGSDPIHPEQNLNIWFVRGTDDFNAYSFRPELTSTPYSGIVVNIEYINGVRNDINFCRFYTTIPHEVGHWAGLYHIWGEEQSCSYDDYVIDTPNMADMYYEYADCDNYLGDTCLPPDDPLDEPDMFENLMSAACCRNFLTQEQVQLTRIYFEEGADRGGFLDYQKEENIADIEFVNFFYFVSLDQECMLNDVKKDYCRKKKNLNEYKTNCQLALCISYSQSKCVDVYEDVGLIVGDDTECNDGYLKMDYILIGGKIEENNYVCYKKVEQSDSLSDATIIDLDIKLTKEQFIIFAETAGGDIYERATSLLIASTGKTEKEKEKVIGDDKYQVIVEHAHELNTYNGVYVKIYGESETDSKVLQTERINDLSRPEWNEEIFEFDEEKDGIGGYISFRFKIYDGDDLLGETDYILTMEIVECDEYYSKDMMIYRDDQKYGTLFITVSKEC